MKVGLHLADLHCGCKIGLMPPDVTLFDEDEKGELIPYTPAQTGTQKYLWRCFRGDLKGASKFADKAPVVVVVDGDITHGTKYPEQLVSTRPADQVIIAVSSIEFIISSIPKIIAIRLVSGTMAHSLGEGSSAIFVARELQAKYPKIDIKLVNHGLFEIEGVTQDVAHHGPSTGIRRWLKGNVLRLYARSLMQEHIERGAKPPRVLIRGHRHEYVHEIITKVVADTEYVIDAFILPSYSGLTHHARQVTQSAHMLGNGMLALACEKGNLVDFHAFRHIADLRTKEKL